MASPTDTTHQVTTGTETTQRTPRRSLVWWMAAGGAAAGIVTLALRRRRESRWDKAKRQAGRLAEGAAKEWKPLVGAAAAAGTAAIVYSRRSKPPRWRQVVDRAGHAARDIEVKPWMTLAATTAVGMMSAYRRRGRAKMRRLPSADATVDKVATSALRIVNRAKRVSREVSRLYPQLRKAFA